MIKIDLCLILIDLWMSSTLLHFQEKYCKYVEEGLEAKILAIGGYESALLAYLVDSYLFGFTDNELKEVLWRLIYRDGRFLVFKSKRSMSDIRIWRDKLQEKVDEIAGN